MADRRSGDATGMAGEFYAMQCLYRLGHQPALTLGAAKSIDIFVRTSSHRFLEVSVKSVCGGGNWGVGRYDWSTRENLVFVFLHFTTFEDIATTPHAYIVPGSVVETIKETWMQQFGVYFDNDRRRANIAPYRDAWTTYFF